MKEIDKIIVEMVAHLKGMEPDCYRLYFLMIVLDSGELK